MTHTFLNETLIFFNYYSNKRGILYNTEKNVKKKRRIIMDSVIVYLAAFGAWIIYDIINECMHKDK